MESDEQLELVRVLEESRRRDLIGPTQIQDQIAHARGFAELIRQDTSGVDRCDVRRVLDLGSGGGLPGLVLAAELPGASLTLLDSSARRCRFLEWALGELGFGQNVGVLHAAAESAAWDPELRSTFDFVTARSFGPPAITAECSRGFLRTDGRLIVSEPPSVGTTPVQRWDRSVLATMGFTAATPARGGDASFAVLTAVGSCPEGIPRRRGLRKRPLFR